MSKKFRDDCGGLCETTRRVPCPIGMPWQSRFIAGVELRGEGERVSPRDKLHRTGRMPVPLRGAFTLIELLVVIAIIGILTALISRVLSPATVNAMKSVAVAERGEMESAIQEYRDRLGFYPPDNPNDSAINPLWFELSGTTNNGVNYVTLDGSGKISLADINAKFHLQGFSNSGKRAQSTDEGCAPVSFLTSLRAKQVAPPDANQPLSKILSCSVGAPSGTNINPWHYVSSHPTHNVGSYDLWVDLVVGGKTYQINNWSKP